MGPRALLSGDRELLKTHESNLPTCGRTAGNLRVQKTRSLSSCPSQGTNLASLGSRTHPWPGAPESLFPVTVVGESAPGRLFPRLSLPPQDGLRWGQEATGGSPFLSLALEEARWRIRRRALGPDTWVTATLPLNSLNLLDPDCLICQLGIIASTPCKGLE